MGFKKYNKIYRVGTDETDGILNGYCYIQEKIDGANASIWMEDGKICCGSRNNKLTKDVDIWEQNNDNGFNGFLEYVRTHEGIQNFIRANPSLRLYGEWLVKHTVNYNEGSYKHFYLFDIENEEEERKSFEFVSETCVEYNIKEPQLFKMIKNPTIDEIREFVGKSELGEKGEGVVIKNFDFCNKFGDLRYGKIVTTRFKEDSQIGFGGNDKHSDNYWEMYIVNKYMTVPRVTKVMQKIESEIGKSQHKDTPRIANVSYHDLLTEEIWDISKKVKGDLSFVILKRLACKKAIQIFHDLLEERIE